MGVALTSCTMNAATSHKLIKSGAEYGLPSHTNQIAAVIFTVVSDDLVKLYTYATWTDYTNTEELSRSDARKAWKELRADGWELGELGCTT